MEIKNINSYKSVGKVIDYEFARQVEILKSGGSVVSETRKWNEDESRTTVMRNKEEVMDYRYFADPDLPKIRISDELVKSLKEQLPLKKEDRIYKYIEDYGLSFNEAEAITTTKVISDFYDECVQILPEYREIALWIMGEMMGRDFVNNMPITPQKFVKVIEMFITNKISRQNARDLLDEVILTQGEPIEIAEKLDMLSKISSKELEGIISQIILENRRAVMDYIESPDRVIQYFVGLAMLQTRGKANPAEIRSIIEKQLNRR